MRQSGRPALFLSSTSADLAPFRQVALHVCQRLGAHVIAMEEFGPDPRAAVELCREKVGTADLFLGLYAHRYGYAPEGFDGRSITQLEYDWALAREPAVPLLLFVADDEFPWSPKLMDHGESWERLQAFIRRVRASHVTGTLTTPEQFRDDLFVHLPRFLDQAPAAVVLRLPPLPAPPKPYVAHRYTLLQTARVIGREAELARLDAWAGEPGSDPLLALVAIGGIGKSALAWEWFHDRAPRTIVPLAGRMWWSFYEADAGFDRFIVAALAYCSGQSVEAVTTLSPTDREYQLLSLLDREPFLLVLDGLERILTAYARLDFAHIPDEELDRSTGHSVTRPEFASDDGGALLGRHRLRQTIDPRAGDFLRKLAQVQASRTLMTTRLFPSKLQTDTGHVLPGSQVWFLTGMQPSDALALWRAMGVSGHETDLEPLFRSIDYHPLLIRAIAGEVAGYRPAPGDLSAWRRAHPDFDPFVLPLVQAKSHVLAYALGNLSPDVRQVLQTVAAFRAPVDYQTVAALFVERRGWLAQRLDEVLSELEDRGLLGWDRAANRYDLHPVVRGVVWSGLDDVGRRALYGQLEEHFKSGPAASVEVRSVDEALPMVELMRALIGLSRWDDAADLYFARLHSSQFDFAFEGMGHVNIALLEGLFPAGLEAPPAVRPSNVHGVIADLGHAYDAAGRLSDAHRCAARNLEQPMGHAPIATDYVYSSERDLQLGRLHLAVRWARFAAALNDATYGRFAIDHLAVCEATAGGYDTALRLLASVGADEFYDPRRSESLVRLWMGDFVMAAELGRQVLAPTISKVGDLEMMIGVAEADLHLGRIQEAEGTLMNVLQEARSKALVRLELRCLRCLAEACRLRGDHASARALLDDLDEPAARGPYRLIQADAANIRALLPDAGPAQRRAAAEDAYRLAWCDGPGYVYHRALELAKRTLQELGVPLPHATAKRHP